ncbi:hypothetical protein ABZX92_31145 [Lentzea sp. NPDC006480]|uniref:hypothetical protein n=1 Tax=Lentzea sp. NPDC006480 TaxID=3157176 RepID=UPI0033AFA95B
MTEPEHDDVAGGAAEQESDAPLTPAEEQSSQTDSDLGAGLDGGGRYGDDG